MGAPELTLRPGTGAEPDGRLRRIQAYGESRGRGLRCRAEQHRTNERSPARARPANPRQIGQSALRGRLDGRSLRTFALAGEGLLRTRTDDADDSPALEL